MTTSIANINGAQLKRLSIEQFGSNLASAVLTQAMLPGTAKYGVTIEDFYISSDIPIFPANTKVFDILSTTGKNGGDGILVNPNVETLSSCVIGPVYNFLDFAYQIQDYLETTRALGNLNLEGSFIPQKNLSFVADETFWNNKIIYMTDEFAEIFEHRIIWARRRLHADPNLNSNTKDAEGHPHDILQDPTHYSDLVELGFAGTPLGIFSSSRMDLFENRHRIKIDSVLPLPHELFAVGSKVENRYTFMEFDFPKETLFSRIGIENSRISDNVQLSQILRTGIFRLLKPSLHSGQKKMITGQSQDQRYEIFIIRKKIQNGVVKLVEEKFPMSGGDYFRLVLLFTREV